MLVAISMMNLLANATKQTPLQDRLEERALILRYLELMVNWVVFTVKFRIGSAGK